MCWALKAAWHAQVWAGWPGEPLPLQIPTASFVINNYSVSLRNQCNSPLCLLRNTATWHPRDRRCGPNGFGTWLSPEGRRSLLLLAKEFSLALVWRRQLLLSFCAPNEHKTKQCVAAGRLKAIPETPEHEDKMAPQIPSNNDGHSWLNPGE